MNQLLKKFNARQFVQYVDGIAKERLERLQVEHTNNVNLKYIIENENVKAFTSIKQGDYLELNMIVSLDVLIYLLMVQLLVM